MERREKAADLIASLLFDRMKREAMKDERKMGDDKFFLEHEDEIKETLLKVFR